MNAAVPPEFEAFAREQVEAGHFASVDDAVAAALRNQLGQIEELRAEIQKGIASLDADEGLDGGAAMRGLIAEAQTRCGV